MTGEEFYKWLNEKKQIISCETDFTLDPHDPGSIVLLGIQIVADDEELYIPYPRLDDEESTVLAKSVSIMLVINRLMNQHGIEKVFNYIPQCDDGGIHKAKEESAKILWMNKKGGK